MPEYISLESDFKDVYEELEVLGKQGKNITRYVLRNIGNKTKTTVKKSYNVYLHKGTGNLYRSITAKLSKRKDLVVVSANTKNDNRVRYGYVNAAGTEIKAKKGKYLTFKIEDKWIKRRSVKIPSRNFVEEPANNYLRSSNMKADMDYYLQKKINKLIEQGKVEVVNENNT